MRYFGDVLRAVAAVPGVRVVGGIDVVPMQGDYRLSYLIEGYQPAAGEPQPSDAVRRVTANYFRAMRQPVIAGREIGESDDARAPPVALVNEAWVRRYFPGKQVIGQRLRLDSKRHGEWRTIVGVVADARENGLEQPAPPVYYLAAAQVAPDELTLVVRGGQPAELREAAAQIDPAQPVDAPQRLEEVVSASLQPRKFPLALLGVFAALALSLAALGIYGVTSYAVAQRTREIGVRMAIGATAGSVVRMVLVSALRTVAAGLALGTSAALASGRVVASQLYGVSAHDPLTFLAISALLVAVALLASGIPALRASRVDPISALRAE
jgi:putative ABC transport system permease protein